MQVVTFCAQARELSMVWKSMNSLLPADIRVVKLQEVPSTFNARHRSASLQFSLSVQSPESLILSLVACKMKHMH